jgi:tetratricopeptide (TPR) repeat protein
MTDKPICVDGEIFLGRIEEQERFREALRSLLAGRQDDDLPFVFLLYGEGGMGKTKLARRIRDIAVDEFKGCFQVIWLDWEKRKPLDVRLAVRDTVSPETAFEHIYAVFRDKGFGREFDPYEKAIKSRAEAETKVAQVLSERVGEGSDRYSALRELGGKGLAWLVRTGLPGGAAIPEEPTTKLFESIIGGGAEGLARAREAATTLLRSKLKPDEFDLFTLPNETLARRLADGIRAAAHKKPLLLVLDTYEIADRADPWLRVVIKRAGLRVVWAIAGRDNLADSRKFGQTYFTGYRADIPGHRLRVFPLAEFSLGDVADYFAWRVPGRPLDEAGLTAIHRATLGIPLAVKEAAAIWETEASLADIVEGVSPRAPREHIVKVMSERFLLHCWDASEDKARVYALALAHRPDPDLLAAMLETETLERDLSDLERRYSFVFVEAMQLHEAVAAFLREYLLAPVRRASREVRYAHERAVKYLEAQREVRQAVLPTLEERVADERWTTAVRGLVHHRFWLDEERGWETLLPAVVGGIAYDRAFARALLETAEPLADTFTRAGARRLKVLQESLSWFSDIEEETALLAELETASRRGWPDDGCGDERATILALRRGQLLHRREQYKEALELYEQAESKLPEQVVALRKQLGEAYYELSNGLLWPRGAKSSMPSRDGLRAAQHAVNLSPENGSAYYNLGVALSDLKRHDEAIAAYKKAIAIEPRATRFNGLGNVYRDLGRHDEAIAEFQRAIQLDPKFAAPHNGLGNVYRALGRHEEAIAAYQRAIQLDPQDAYPHHGLGNVYRDLGRHEEAIAAYQRAIQLDPQYAYPHNGLGIVYRDLGRHEEAIAAYQRAIELDPQYAYPHNGLGIVYRDLGRHEEAIAAYQRAIELDPESESAAFAHNNLADVYIVLGRFEEARQALAKRLRLKPDNTFAPLVTLGVLARHQGQPESEQHLRQALAQWEKAWHDRLQTPAGLLENKAKALLCMGKKDEALKTLAEAITQMLPGDTIEFDDYKLLQASPAPPDGIEQMIKMLEQAQDDPRFQELVGESPAT